MTVAEFKAMVGVSSLDFKPVKDGKLMCKAAQYTVLTAREFDPNKSEKYIYSGYGATTSAGEVIDDKFFYFLSNKANWDAKETTMSL